MNKLIKFLNSKIRVEYSRYETVPFYKGYWYLDEHREVYMCIILPLNIPLGIVRNLWQLIRIFCYDSERFYRNQLKLRKDEKERNNNLSINPNYYIK